MIDLNHTNVDSSLTKKEGIRLWFQQIDGFVREGKQHLCNWGDFAIQYTAIISCGSHSWGCWWVCWHPRFWWISLDFTHRILVRWCHYMQMVFCLQGSNPTPGGPWCLLPRCMIQCCVGWRAQSDMFVLPLVLVGEVFFDHAEYSKSTFALFVISTTNDCWSCRTQHRGLCVAPCWMSRSWSLVWQPQLGGVICY